MNERWLVCMAVWTVFIGLWAYYGPVKKYWFIALPFSVAALIAALLGVMFSLTG